MQTSQRRNFITGFTLIELLVVIAIISLLAAILFPVFGRARENARRTSCLSNNKQVGLSIMQYVQDNDELFPWQYIGNPGQRPSWYDKTEAYIRNPQVVICPSDETKNKIAVITYEGHLSPNPSMNWNPNIAGAYLASPPATKYGMNVAVIKEPARVLLLTPIQTNASNPPRTLSANDYEYGLTHAQTGIIDAVDRHFEGENWLFCDGHAKYLTLDQIHRSDSGRDESKQAWWSPQG